MKPKKSLGQHWLKDKPTLESICQAASLNQKDIVIEIGPGLGDLTKLLVKKTGKVIAIELDNILAQKLSWYIKASNLVVEQGDILEYDFSQLPPDYKVVANIPYYLTSNLIRTLSETPNPPLLMVLLVQKEVAQRVAAPPGKTSLLSVSAQLYYEPKLGQVVPSTMFEPQPKVDSQVIILNRRKDPLFDNLDTKIYFRLIKAGFAGRRKKLRGSLAAGLGIDKTEADRLLAAADIDGGLRAQDLNLDDWYKIYKSYISKFKPKA
jgi:16S rRNA (adenine1518-N6/adenine1519-N6)-dimethyltransferase